MTQKSPAGEWRKKRALPYSATLCCNRAFTIPSRAS